MKIKFFWYSGKEYYQYRWDMRGFSLSSEIGSWTNFHYRTLIGLTGINWTIRKRLFLKSWKSLLDFKLRFDIL